MDAPALAALIEEATKKSGLIWVRPSGPGHHAQAVWHVWQDGAAWVLSGGIEQAMPELAEHAYVTVRSKDKGARLVTWVAAVQRILPGTPEWDSVVPALQGKRLNLPDGEAAPARWAQECTIWRLAPTGEVSESPDAPSTNSHAVEPPATPARSHVPKPLHLRGRPAVRGRRGGTQR
ncbi:MAG TPA: hypothetical protein VFH54_16610 [Mycobacteriales bacterium]|nr:hypothetical protein [Mycobacteriales bacterium]